MTRLITRTLFTLTVLLAVTCLILLPLSHRHRLFLGWQRFEQGTPPDNHSIELFVTKGSLGFEFYARDTFWLSTYQLVPPDWYHRRGLYAGASIAHPASAFSPSESFDRFGFHLHHDHQPRSYAAAVLGHTIVAIPLWPLFLFSATLPTLALIRRHRTRRRASAHRCPACNYDLRATPDRCPECGRNIPTPSATTPSP